MNLPSRSSLRIRWICLLDKPMICITRALQQERYASLELFMKTIQKEIHEYRGVTVYLPYFETVFVFGAVVYFDADGWIGTRSELSVHPKPL